VWTTNFGKAQTSGMDFGRLLDAGQGVAWVVGAVYLAALWVKEQTQKEGRRCSELHDKRKNAEVAEPVVDQVEAMIRASAENALAELHRRARETRAAEGPAETACRRAALERAACSSFWTTPVPERQTEPERPVAKAPEPAVVTTKGWNVFAADEEMMEGPAPKDLELFGVVIARKGEVISFQEVRRRIAQVDKLPAVRRAFATGKVTMTSLRRIEARLAREKAERMATETAELLDGAGTDWTPRGGTA
jgi:hypothetical protein